MRKNSWKKAWEHCEMDQAAREDKRQVKKRQHKKNRKACKDGLRKEDFDNQDVLDWKDLNNDDRR